MNTPVLYRGWRIVPYQPEDQDPADPSYMTISRPIGRNGEPTGDGGIMTNGGDRDEAIRHAKEMIDFAIEDDDYEEDDE